MSSVLTDGKRKLADYFDQVAGEVPFDTLSLVGLLILSPLIPSTSLTQHLQISKGLSVHGWPSGHALDSEETIQFTELENVKCMVEEFPLDKVNEAFGRSLRVGLVYNQVTS